MTANDAFVWLALLVCFIGGLIFIGAILRPLDNPYFQAKRFRDASKRFGEIIRGE